MPAPSDRRTDHRAYAIRCPYEGCNAGPWRACVGCGGALMDEPHPERVAAEMAERGGKGTTPAQRTPDLFFADDGLPAFGFEPNPRGKIEP
jgi:hypothetical protein